MIPSDQSVRDRFVSEVERNFSVIAPAGVGKTRAIVDRIIHIATSDPDRAREWLPKLVVATYTRKAADEMHQRARNAIIQRGTDLTILGAFHRAFFGTIHSFCQRLLTTYGCHLGLPARIELAEGDELWPAFVRQLSTVAPRVPQTVRDACFRHAPMDDLIGLAQHMRPELVPNTLPGPCPAIDITALLRCTHKRPDVLRNIEQGQALARQFADACKRGDGYVPIPAWKKGGADFLGAWDATFEPLRAWLRDASRLIAADIARDYRDYRLAQGKLTYDDQISLALELIKHPDAGRAIREEGYRVILDEAQDTDPVQFEVLLALSGDAEPGRFSMVGDPQQSIYGSRADLAMYQSIHRDLLDRSRAEELIFAVTFRCDHAIVNEVNRLAPDMLDGKEGQAAFVPLVARPDAGPGRVVRWVPDGDVDVDLAVEARARIEALQLAGWIGKQGLENLGATAWSEVAILCPRTKWLATIRLALEEIGLPAQVQSERDIEGDHPACAWFTALVRVAAEPRNGFELAGVLREIFGISDQDLADFSRGDGARFRIDQPATGTGAVADTLNLLRAARDRAIALPLRDAAQSLVEATALRARLASIHNDSDDVLNGLLVRTAEAEAGGATLAEWSGDLQTSFLRTVESRTVDRDAIQLITCQKAKGLQWETVILPMLFRPIGEKTPDYPLLLRTGPGQPPAVALDGNDYDEVKETVELRKRQEYRRLLYVAMTRAKSTLIVADDAALFAKQEKSFAALLDILDGPRAKAFRAWPTELFPMVGKNAAEISNDWKISAGPKLDLEAARVRSGNFVRRVLPSSLAVHGDVEPELKLDADPEWGSAGNEAARAYGTWWHEMVERIAWHEERGAWQRIFDAALSTCPQRERGVREWELFLASDLSDELQEPGQVCHAEMPIFWKRGGEVLEGLIDLAVLMPAKRRWRVIDWKTNESGDLRAIYAPQVAAYAAALNGITGFAAECGVYSTVTGKWIECR